ncbi:MAG: homocysteine S-methyltransferase family protein [Oscillospiraceae bacterium]|nr:homocysteine S-methyltransferase family protein [Oscillospiraceae bacterium]
MIDLNRHIIFDGGFGTMLQAAGLEAGHNPERLNLSCPDKVRAIHAAYAAAGSDVITANTFGASRRKLGEDPEPFIVAGVALAREAAAPYGAKAALDVGPLGALMEPFGELTFDEAYDSFAEIVEAGARAGADLILIETMSDLLETKAALLAAKEHTDLPVFVTMTFGEDGKTFIGVDPAAAAITLTSLGADAIGVNCSLGPDKLLPVVETLLSATHLPIIVQPNAGIPRLVDGKTVFDVEAEEFAHWAKRFAEMGVAILGGCCGTTPEHIAALRRVIEGHVPTKREKKEICRLCGWQGSVPCGMDDIRTVGELINPTGRKKLTDALHSKNWEYAAELAIEQTEDGADFIVVNAGLPDIDEKEALSAMVLAIQKVTSLPLVIDCSDPVALERALRVCRGRPILNSVHGSRKSVDEILPLAVKYGTALIVLALEEGGIAAGAQNRCDAGLRVAQTAQYAGVAKHDIFVDCLALSASADQKGLLATVDAIRLVREQGYKTVLGVSNVSYGLPDRDILNCTFLSACLMAGLNVPIVMVGSQGIRGTIDAARVLLARDEGCAAYISRHAGSVAVNAEKTTSLKELIVGGRKSEVRDATERLLHRYQPVDVINGYIVPALDEVGEAYEKGTLFLPQLMSCAEVVKLAFDVLKEHMSTEDSGKGTVVLATVRGDMHDIGKNIVKMLLENYGYRVIDLGKDVHENTLVEAVREHNAKLVGLSALMTTTAQNMEGAIRALREAEPDCKVMIGGAVINQNFARQIGADYYAKDAAQSARIAAEVFGV